MISNSTFKGYCPKYLQRLNNICSCSNTMSYICFPKDPPTKIFGKSKGKGGDRPLLREFLPENVYRHASTTY